MTDPVVVQGVTTDWTGVRMGTFTGIDRTGTVERDRDGHAVALWLFRCDCGSERTLSSHALAYRQRRRQGLRCAACFVNPPRKRDTRRRVIRAQSVSRRSAIKELKAGRELYPEDTSALRPVVRAECEDFGRPCPFVSCRWNLYLDVNPRTGSIKLNFPDLEPDELGVSCCLDVADAGGASLEDVGSMMNMTRERVRQIEVQALAQLERATGRSPLNDYAPERAEVGRRRLPVLQEASR